MPTIREKVRKRVIKKKVNQTEQTLLFLGFWLVLLIECVGLYSRNYTVYTFSRVLIVPILLLRIFLSSFYKRVSIYIYFTLILSLTADFFTIFGNYSVGYVGLSLYTVSYLSLGCYFQQLGNNHNKSHLAFIIGALIQAALCLLWIFSPELRLKSFFLQVGFHCVVLVYLSFWILNNFNKVFGRVSILIASTLLIVLLTNILYGLDLYYFQRKYGIIDALVGFGNGFYLFLITRGALKQVKKQ